MPGLSFVFVGRMKEPHFEAAFAEYMKRLGGYAKCELREIAEQRLGEKPSEREIAAALEREAREIERAIPKGAYLCAMCVEGVQRSSEELAKLFRELDSRGVGRICFLVGGSYGLDAALKRRADLRLSMSRMTFPHHLARVMLAEQAYRAFTINAGKRYHK